MKRLFLSLTFFLAYNMLNAQETFRFCASHPQGLSIENSTKSMLSLHYSIVELGITNVQCDEAKGQEIILKGCFASNAEGLPNLPFVNQYIAVPKGAKVSIEVKEKASQTLQNIELLPSAPLQINSENKRPALRWDMSVFGNDTDYPSENVTVAQTTTIRGLDVVMLSVTPFRYNPARKTLEVIYDIDIEMHFEGGNGQFGDSRYRNPEWDNILRDVVINSDMLSESKYYDFLNQAIQNREEGCEYLIISPDDEDILAWAETLKDFRTKQGILTKVVSTTECGGNDPETVRNYILNAYNNWTIPPAAVLMFSASNRYSDFGVKPFVFNFNTDYFIYNYPTDNPFADMNGDSIPDLAISRILAYTPAEYEQMVRRTIDYELNPPTDDHYYDHPIVTSNYQEDLWFMITSQSVNGFFRDKLGKHPTNLYMMYDYYDDGLPIPDSIWSTDENTSTVLDYYGPNGTGYIPISIGALKDWKNMHQTSLLIDAFNQESFLTFYRDHSAYDYWCAPFFDAMFDIDMLQNEKPTFIFSIGCLTNGYYHSQEDCCLIQYFCKADNGITGGIGAAAATYSKYNDLLSWGMLDYIWPNFMPTLGTYSQPEFAYPGFSLVAGKIFLNQQNFKPFWTEGIHQTENLWGYTGDTYLSLYTETPQQMQANFDSFHPNDQRQFPFTIEEGAKVCISMNGEILQVLQSTGQVQSVMLPPLEIGQTFTLTATKRNRVRIEQNVTIIPTNQAYCYLKVATCNDQNGNGQCDYGEHISFNLSLCNTGSMASEGAEVTLSCDSPFVEIMDGTAYYPHIDCGANHELLNAFRVRIANNVPDQTEIKFTVQFNEGLNTHKDSFNITVNAPNLQIHPEIGFVTEQGEPSTHIEAEGKTSVTFSFTNIGHAPTEPICASLDIKAPFVSCEAAHLDENLHPHETTTLSLDVNTEPNYIEAGWLQAQFHVQYGAYQTSFDTIMQYGGIFENFETDTLNPFFIWTNSAGQPWEYCVEDAFEGERCLISTADTANYSQLRARLRSKLIDHDAKISFHYKTAPDESLMYYSMSFNGNTMFSSPEWHYGEVVFSSRDVWFNWHFEKDNIDSQQAKIDDICFPPKHTAIAYAGDNLILCNATSVTLNGAYAYDHQSSFWTTGGDGQFEDETAINTVYIPGEQDFIEGSVALTLHALSQTDTINSTIHLTLLDNFNLTGHIEGDSIVNKYENRISHYSIEEQEGVHYLWQIDPVEAGVIYDQNNSVDIAWNLYEGDAEVTLSVTADNGCEMEPVTKTISLIGYSTSEWQSVSFDLFPNPTDGKVNLVVGETLQGKAVVEVYNLLGEQMMINNFHHLQKGETLTLDLSNFVSGLYIIKLSTEKGHCTKKVSVK